MQHYGSFIPPVVTALGASTGDNEVVRLATDGELYEDVPSGWRRVRAPSVIEADSSHLDSAALPSTYPAGFSASTNPDMTGWTILRPPGQPALNTPLRIETYVNSTNGGFQRVSFRDSDGVPVSRQRTATANAWNAWGTGTSRGGLLATPTDGLTSASLPSAYWEGTTVMQLSTPGTAPFAGTLTTVRAVSTLETTYQTLVSQPAADATTPPRLAYRARQPGVDAWGPWRESDSGPGTSWRATIDLTSLSGAGIDNGYLMTAVGTGAAWSGVSPVTGNRIGVGRISLGTVATNYGAIHLSNTSSIRFGAGVARHTSALAIFSLSDATNSYVIRAGFIEAANTEPTDGAFFRYTNGVNAGKWQAVTRANGVETAVDTGVVGTAGAWLTLQVEVNAAATSAVFRMNGATVATIGTNIPTGAGRDTGSGVHAMRTLGTAGVGAMDVDFVDTEIVFSTPRY